MTAAKATIEVIYQNGVLRPVQPLDLAEGTRLEVTLIRPPVESEPSGVDEDRYTALLDELGRIAALPLQTAPQPQTVRDHDAIHYPKQGRMP